MSFGLDAFDSFGFVFLKTVGFLHRISRQSEPTNLLLFLVDNVHGHENVERIVDASPNVLLVVLLIGGGRASRIGQFVDELVGYFVVRGRALCLYFFTYLENVSIESVFKNATAFVSIYVRSRNAS